MLRNRTWRRGDSYWELWARLDTNRFFPMCVGVVEAVENCVIRLQGTWRYIDEGLAFACRADAELYASQHAPNRSEPEPPRSAVRRSSPAAAFEPASLALSAKR
jgi:hypothetical protein